MNNLNNEQIGIIGLLLTLLTILLGLVGLSPEQLSILLGILFFLALGIEGVLLIKARQSGSAVVNSSADPLIHLLLYIVIAATGIGTIILLALPNQAEALSPTPAPTSTSTSPAPTPASTLTPTLPAISSTMTNTIDSNVQDGNLVNSEFEDGNEISPWQWSGPCENYDVQKGESYVRSGNFLAALNRGANCHSFYQDVEIKPIVGETYSFGIWIASPNNEPRNVRLEIIASGGQESEEVNLTPHLITGNEWTCKETSLEIEGDGHTSLQVRVHLDSTDGIAYHFDGAMLEPGEAKLCPQPIDLGQLYRNGGFEEEEKRNFSDWRGLTDCPVVERRADGTAHGGQFYLFITSGTACGYFSQDIKEPPPVIGETYSFRVWVRSSGEATLNGEVVIWGGENEMDLETEEDEEDEKGGQLFQVHGDTWQCVETQLTLQDSDTNVLRAEIYLKSPPGAEYYFDDAHFEIGDVPLCPELSIESVQLREREAFYPGSTIGVDASVQNIGGAEASPSQLLLWVAGAENGNPIQENFKVTITVPSLALDTIGAALYGDARIPVGLEPGPYYVVSEISATAQLGEDQSSNRVSQLFELSPCSEETYFCDVPSGYWGQPEMETWGNLGFTSGCVGNTTEYVDRPFCPEQLLPREQLATFLVRHIKGADFDESERTYEGYFADVPPNHYWVRWIEELHEIGIEIGIDLNSDRCLTQGDKPSFCPGLPVERGELAIYLAQVLQWDLEPEGGNTFAEMSAHAQEELALEYMWRQGFIPEPDPSCPATEAERGLCPNNFLTRADAAVFMTRAFGLVEVVPRPQDE